MDPVSFASGFVVGVVFTVVAFITLAGMSG